MCSAKLRAGGSVRREVSQGRLSANAYTQAGDLVSFGLVTAWAAQAGSGCAVPLQQQKLKAEIRQLKLELANRDHQGPRGFVSSYGGVVDGSCRGHWCFRGTLEIPTRSAAPANGRPRRSAQRALRQQSGIPGRPQRHAKKRAHRHHRRTAPTGDPPILAHFTRPRVAERRPLLKQIQRVSFTVTTFTPSRPCEWRPAFGWPPVDHAATSA